MLSATLREGLGAYQVGAKIRALRLKKKMALVELGLHTGLSPALLSKLERERIFPTLPTLLRIALVFSVGLDYFFVNARERPVLAVTRKRARVALPERAGLREASYRFESLDFEVAERRFNSYYAEFLPHPTDRLRPHSHPGVEFLYLLQGTLELDVDGHAERLGSGDTVYFDSTVPHAYRRVGRRPCSAIVVIGT
jgi:transcriptional regulator with XRE-family HTH domain